MIRAMDWMNSLPWNGYKTNADQATCFPREGLYDEDGYAIENNEIPTVVIHAHLEAAYREFVTSGSLEPDLIRGGKVKRKRTDVLETEYFSGAPSGTVYVQIKNRLRPYLKASGTVELVRC